MVSVGGAGLKERALTQDSRGVAHGSGVGELPGFDTSVARGVSRGSWLVGVVVEGVAYAGEEGCF